MSHLLFKLGFPISLEQNEKDIEKKNGKFLPYPDMFYEFQMMMVTERSIYEHNTTYWTGISPLLFHMFICLL